MQEIANRDLARGCEPHGGDSRAAHVLLKRPLAPQTHIEDPVKPLPSNRHACRASVIFVLVLFRYFLGLVSAMIDIC